MPDTIEPASMGDARVFHQMTSTTHSPSAPERPHDDESMSISDSPPEATSAEEHDDARESGPTLESVAVREAFNALFTLCARYLSHAELAMIADALHMAEAAHAGMARKSGEPFIIHPIAVARILAELAMDAQGIAAALLHDTVEDTRIALDDITARFGPVVANIVDGVTKFEFVPSAPDAENGEVALHDLATQTAERKAIQQSETVRKLFYAASAEPRVVLLKLADRLHNLRTLGAMSPAQQYRTANETREIYAPLAGRIGLYLMKAELEDLAFLYLEPELYASIEAKLRDEAQKRTEWAERMERRMRRALASAGVLASVNWRVKRVYRSYMEARERGVDVTQLNDLIAFRVLTHNTEDCYPALHVIHSLWRPLEGRTSDFLSWPKANGYQSLHTEVFGLDGWLSHIHIRTHFLHRVAQHGITTYWLERAAKASERHTTAETEAPIDVDGILRWVSRLSSGATELGMNARDFLETVRGDLQEEQIVVQTPKGRPVQLPAGATVLDFAYQIHSEIGDHAAGALIQTPVGIDPPTPHAEDVHYTLRNGEIIQVVQDASAWPHEDWLDVARTPTALRRIKAALARQRRGGERERGETPRDEPDVVRVGQAMAQPWSAPRGDGGQPLAATRNAETQRLRHPSGALAVVELARCCYPCPGDKVRGVPQARARVVIHRQCCRTLGFALARRRAAGLAHPDGVEVGWPQIQPITFRAHLLFDGQDHMGLMNDISEHARRLGLNVSGSEAFSNAARRAAVALTVDLPPPMRLDDVLRKMRRAPGILSVRRDLRQGCGLAGEAEYQRPISSQGAGRRER